MSNKPASVFSNGTEYEVFLYNFCERCRNYKLRESDGFPEFPENGGCKVLDAMENARFDTSLFPSEWIRELRDADDKIIAWHYCTRFSNPDYENVMVPYFTMMKKALAKKEAKPDGESNV